MVDPEIPFEIEGAYTPPEFKSIWNECGVYAVYNVLSDCRYVARAKGMGARMRDHYEWLRKRTRQLNARMLWDLDRLGKGVAPFRFAVLRRCGPEAYVAEEARWIKTLEANYNMTGGFKMPPEFYRAPESSPR